MSHLTVALTDVSGSQPKQYTLFSIPHFLFTYSILYLFFKYRFKWSIQISFYITTVYTHLHFMLAIT